MKQTFTDKFQVRLTKKQKGKNWWIDNKGYLHIKAIAARSGVLKYPERGFNTYMPADSIKAGAKTLEDVSLVDQTDHDEDVTSEDAEDKTLGWVKSGSVYFENGILYCEIVVISQWLIEQITSGGDHELSCRYEGECKPEKGQHGDDRYDYIVIKITYNHIAVVDRGRAGNAKFLTDRKVNMNQKNGDTQSYARVKLPAVQTAERNLGETVVNIYSDRAGDEQQVQDRLTMMSDHLVTLSDQNKDLELKLSQAEIERDTALEQVKQLSDKQSKMVPTDKIIVLADELVDARETCSELGVKLSDAEKKSPFLAKLKASECVNPLTTKKFTDQYKKELESGELTEVMEIKVQTLYDSAKEQKDTYLEDKFVEDAFNSGNNFSQGNGEFNNFSDAQQGGYDEEDPIAMVHQISYGG